MIALGGDGFMLQTLHTLLERRAPIVPVFGMNLGTVGFLMNDYSEDNAAYILHPSLIDSALQAAIEASAISSAVIGRCGDIDGVWMAPVTAQLMKIGRAHV